MSETGGRCGDGDGHDKILGDDGTGDDTREGGIQQGGGGDDGIGDFLGTEETAGCWTRIADGPSGEAGREGLRVARLTPVLRNNQPPSRSRLLLEFILRLGVVQAKAQDLGKLELIHQGNGRGGNVCKAESFQGT